MSYLAATESMTAAQFRTMVDHESGLLGLSETSGDVRDLLAREAHDPRAAEAQALFCYQAKKWIGGFTAALVEEGTITTAFDMAVLNEMDRFHLVIDAIHRLPQTGSRGVYLQQRLRDKLVEHKRYIDLHGGHARDPRLGLGRLSLSLTAAPVGCRHPLAAPALRLCPRCASTLTSARHCRTPSAPEHINSQ